MSSTTTGPPPEPLLFPPAFRSALQPYLPLPPSPSARTTPITPPHPHLTLTYAQSLDGMLSLAPTLQTALSSPLSKSMTHYLRSRHDAILIGSNTACTDDPSLNCRFAEDMDAGIVGWERQPQPVVLDPARKWKPSRSRVLKVAGERRGRAVWWVVCCGRGRGRGGSRCGDADVEEGDEDEDEDEEEKAVREAGGEVIRIREFTTTTQHWPFVDSSPPGAAAAASPPSSTFISWDSILSALAVRGIRSVMVEGGARIINGLYSPENQKFVTSVIVTVAPKYLGKGGVVVCPSREVEGRPAVELRDVIWVPLGRDGVMAGRIQLGDGDAVGRVSRVRDTSIEKNEVA